MSLKRPDRVVFYDQDPLPPRILVTAWRVGTLFDRTPHSYGIRNWDGMLSILESLRDSGVRVREIQIWGHGYVHGPVLGQHAEKMTNEVLERLAQVAPHLGRIWFRVCSAGQSYSFARRCRRFLPDVELVMHAEVIGMVRIGKRSIPVGFWQGSGVALRPNEEPWWLEDGVRLRGCIATKMKVPRSFYKPRS